MFFCYYIYKTIISLDSVIVSLDNVIHGLDNSIVSLDKIIVSFDNAHAFLNKQLFATHGMR